MNVFGSSQAGETNKFVTNLEKTIKSFSSKLDKIEHLLEENQKSVNIQQEQTETLQLIIIDYIKKSEASLHYIKENTDTLKNKP